MTPVLLKRLDRDVTAAGRIVDFSDGNSLIGGHPSSQYDNVAPARRNRTFGLSDLTSAAATLNQEKVRFRPSVKARSTSFQ